MKQTTWRDQRLVKAMNTAGVVPVRIDAKDNINVLARLGIKSLPTTFIVKPDLKIAERAQGYRTADQLLQALEKYTRSVEKKEDTRVAVK